MDVSNPTINRDYWNGRRVLLTGHTGFKGSWLTVWLKTLGAQIIGYGLPPPTTPSLYELVRASDGITSIIGDIRSFDLLKETLREQRPEVVFHMAAQSVVRHSQEDPLETYTTNVIGTVNLLEAIRQQRLECVVVNVTSDKCYENRNSVWGYRETDPLGGHDPYSSSKACAELVTAAFRDSYFTPGNSKKPSVVIASARAGNVIGGGDWTPYQLIPDIIRAFLDNRAVRLRNPDAVRPWQFVLEPLRGYLLLAERLSVDGSRFAEGWNFGPIAQDAKSVRCIAQLTSTLWGNDARWETDPGDHPYEAHLLKLDISKSTSRLGWSPKIRLDQALRWVVEWYKAFAEERDLREVTQSQIQRYETLPAME
jgi:CDP-glucose 4,6-dehydratase